MSYDIDEESVPLKHDSRDSERFSTISTMVADYDQKLTNTSKELNLISQKISNKLKYAYLFYNYRDYSTNREEVLSLFNNMIELTHHMNETIVKSQQTPDFTARESKMNTIKWKNISLKYIKQVKTLENAILQKQKDLNKQDMVKNGKYTDESHSLIEPEFTGEEGQGLKQRNKGSTQGESFEDFMRRRSRRIGKL